MTTDIAPDAPHPRDDDTPPDDPAAPLEAQVAAVARHMAHHRLPVDDCDPIICSCRGVPCGLTVGDLRAAVEAIRDLRAQLVLVDPDVYLAEHQEAVDQCSRADAAEAEIERLHDENRSLRTDLDAACSAFSEWTWVGRLDMPSAFHVGRGRKMAMLSPATKEGQGNG